MNKMWMIAIALVMIFTGCMSREERFNRSVDAMVRQNRENYYRLITFHSSPKYSPDGKRIIFTARVKGYNRLYIYDREQEQVIQGFEGGDFYTPAFSPNSEKIAFTTGQEKGNKGYRILWIINTNGSGLKEIRMVNANIEAVVFSMDSEALYYSYNIPGQSQSQKIYYNRDGVETVIVTNQFWGVKKIVPVNNEEDLLFEAEFSEKPGWPALKHLYHYHMKSMELTVLGGISPKAKNYLYGSEYIAELYNKDRVYYYGGIAQSNNAINCDYYIFKYDSSTRNSEVFIRPNYGFSGDNLSLAPDGQRILCLRYYPAGPGADTNAICEINIDGSGFKQIPITEEMLLQAPMVRLDVRKKL